MKSENNYDFLFRMREIHHPNRRDLNAVPVAGETVITDEWSIAIPPDASRMVFRAAEDLCDYLLVSMGVSIPIRNATQNAAQQVYLEIANEGGALHGFTITVAPDRVSLRGNGERGILFGVIRLEDLMNLREAPFLEHGVFKRNPLARMRSVHSGSGMDDFPDWQLNAILHAGFTAIDIFVKGIDVASCGHCNINNIIDRAAEYGLDTVLYNKVECYVHPDAPDAGAAFDAAYGSLARTYSKAAAIHFVGESLAFPSNDPATTGKKWTESVIDGIPDPRPSPGWYPCRDYPAYMKRIVDAVHKVNPEMEVILNTYNWGYCPLEKRKELLAAMPKGLTIHVTYDIFKENIRDNELKCPVMDYSISAAEPGFYFRSESEAAAELGLPVRVTSNLAGATWDFGSVPYVPVPQRWLIRMNIIKKYLLQYGVTSFYETHHYGWWPNPANDLAKEVFASNDETDLDAFLFKIATRDYGKAAAFRIVEAWRLWSCAMDHYVGANEDQYGPWRVGPAYPFIFQPNISRTMSGKEITFPTASRAYFGNRIIKTLYAPYENENQSPGPMRYPVEIKELEAMLELWKQGLAMLDAAREQMPEQKRENGQRLWALTEFIHRSIITVIHIKRWWLLNVRLQSLSEREPMLDCLAEIGQLAEAEIANVKATFAAVEADSRLGWEPSMEYVCDTWHLNWKLRQMESMKRELVAYRSMIVL